MKWLKIWFFEGRDEWVKKFLQFGLLVLSETYVLSVVFVLTYIEGEVIL